MSNPYGLPAYLPYGANLAVGATLTPSTEDSDYPVENLVDGLVGVRFKCTGNSGSLELDLGSAMSVSDVVLGNHNFDSGATIQIKAGSGSPPSTVIATMTYRAYDMWAHFAAASHRYWLIDGLTTAESQVAFGQISLGVAVQFPRRFAYDGIRGKGRVRSLIEHESESGVRRSLLRFERQRFAYRFAPLTEDEINNYIDAFDLATKGSVYALAWMPDISGSDVYYSRVDDSNFQPSSNSHGFFTWDLRMTEEGRGGAIS